MTEQATTLTRHDLEAKIVKRCWENEAFHREFTADPGGTFVKHLSVQRAGLPNIVVHEEEPDCWHIVIPLKPTNAGELSEEDLEKVAGGTTPTVVATVAASVIGTVATYISVSATIAYASVDVGW
jgi:hypothetical protein